jgi:uncharacterized protein YndB with AHSA1/START domain
MPGNTVNLLRVFTAPPQRLYNAFLDPAAMSKWLPPNGFTGTVHSMDARVGGKYSMSFTNLTTGQSHKFGGEYQELIPNERLRYSDKFDDPNFPGTMNTVINLRAVPSGTELSVTQDGIPDAIPIDGCYVGWQQSLHLLALLTEAEIPS